jgi:hypothetical protein
METATNGNSNGNGIPSQPIPGAIYFTPPTSQSPLNQSDRDEIMHLIRMIRDKLPFLQDLTAEERQTLLGMRDKNRAFAGKVLEVCTQNPDFLPRSFNPDQLRDNLALFDHLTSILMSLTQLRNLVDATSIAIGSQAYEQSLDTYRHAKVSGYGASLESMMTDMKQHFTRKSKKKEKPLPEVPPSSSEPIEEPEQI